MIELSRNMENGVRTDQQNIVDSPPTSPSHRLPFHTIDFDESTDNILHGMARASVSPAQPRPGRTIEPVLAQNSTRIPNVTPEVDPISRAAKDPYLTAVALEKACTLLACRLADIIFGPDVLAHSNLTGRDDRTALNPPDMNCTGDTVWYHINWLTSGQGIQSCAVITWSSIVRYYMNSYRNYVNPGYFSLAATALKPQQIPMFLHTSARVWGRRWSPHTSEQRCSMLKPK